VKSDYSFLEYYRRELGYLRTHGLEFAKKYPRVAGRLDFGSSESTDPHTERLIEAFAFLAARVHRDLENEFPLISDSLIDSVCPNLSHFVPSMTIVQLEADPLAGKVTSGSVVPAGSMLTAKLPSGEDCRFRVAWDTTLWPLRISDVRLVSGRTLGLKIECVPGMAVNELEVDSLRIHLSGDLMVTMPLHERIIAGLKTIQIETETGVVTDLGPNCISEVGYADGEEILVLPSHTNSAYALLQQYFGFPRGFQFFDINGLKNRIGNGGSFWVHFVFEAASPFFSRLREENFKLGCVPVINLFQMTAEPVAIDSRQHEYLLVPDFKKDRSTEIHSIVSVSRIEDGEGGTSEIRNVFGATELDLEATGVSWISRQDLSLRSDIVGSDTYISFIDGRDVRKAPDRALIYARVWCSNRGYAERVAAGSRLIMEDLPRKIHAQVLYPPSAQREPMTKDRSLWTLVNILRINYHTLFQAAPEAALSSVQRLLSLFAGGGGHEQNQVLGLTKVSCERSVARIGVDVWRGYCRGVSVSLEFEASAYAGGSPLLLASVLARFFALYTTANSFVRLEVLRQGEVWHRWPPMSGRQCLI
jgi:type VI secretion system protein ImpG